MPSIRKALDEHPTIVTIVAVLVLFGALAAIIVNLRGPSSGQRITELWYYDLNTGALFEAEAQATPPIAAPSDDPGIAPANGSGVRAHVFSCGSCDDADERFIAYLERYTPEAREQIVRMKANPDSPEMMEMYPPDAMESQLIAEPDTLEWVPMMSEAGTRIQQRIMDQCREDESPRPCFP